MKTFSAAVRDAIGSEEPIATGGRRDFATTTDTSEKTGTETTNKRIITTAHDAVG